MSDDKPPLEAFAPASGQEDALTDAPFPSAFAPRDQHDAAPRRKKRKAREPGLSRFAYVIAAFASLIWSVSVISFALGYKSMDWAFEFQPVQIILLSLVCILPAFLMAITAYSIRQAGDLSKEARLSREATDAMVAPAVRAAGETADLVTLVRTEIDRAIGVAAHASEEISALRITLAEEAEKMSATVADAERVARLLSEGLGSERLEMGVLSAELDTRAASIASAIQRQAKMVAEASDLAQTQIREAEALLAARAADLAAAAADAGEVGALASQQFALSAEHLEQVSTDVAHRIDSMSGSLSRERDQLAGVAETLRTEHGAVSERLDAQRRLLIEAVAESRVSAQDMHVAATHGADTLRHLIAEAAAQVGALAETARAEQDAMVSQSRERLKLFAESMTDEREMLDAANRNAVHQMLQAADEARRAVSQEVVNHAETTVETTRAALLSLAKAADEARAAAAEQLAETERLASSHTENARRQLDDLGEAAFAASRRADEVFDSRIASARNLVEESARLVEEAGLRSAEKIEVGLSATREALADLETLLAEVDLRAGDLPDHARASVDAVRNAVTRGVSELTEAARRAAEETQVIDLAFQERVKRNYEMLSESVKLMSEVAGAADAVASQSMQSLVETPRPAPPPQTPPPPDIARAMEEARINALAAMSEATRQRKIASGGSLASASEHGEDDTPLSFGGTGRSKLRLTPTDQDRAVSSVFEPARPERRSEPAQGEPWSLRDLLKNMDETAPAPPRDGAVGERLVRELNGLGVDSAALLPRSRVEDIARSLNQGDLDAGRGFIRRLAPAATRRLARRIDSDPTLRSDAARFVSSFGDKLIEALSREGAAAELLSTDQGRTFLLLDAAISLPRQP